MRISIETYSISYKSVYYPLFISGLPPGRILHQRHFSYVRLQRRYQNEKSLTELGRERINPIRKWLRKNPIRCITTHTISDQMCREIGAENLQKIPLPVSVSK